MLDLIMFLITFYGSISNLMLVPYAHANIEQHDVVEVIVDPRI